MLARSKWSCNLLGHICCKQLLQTSSSRGFFLLSSYFLFQFLPTFNSFSKFVKTALAWMKNLLQQSWVGLRILWIILAQQFFSLASRPKYLPRDVFLTIFNASPSVIKEMRAWRAWAETTLGTIIEANFKAWLCDLLVTLSHDLCHNLHSVLITAFDPSLELVPPAIPSTRGSNELEFGLLNLMNTPWAQFSTFHSSSLKVAWKH